MAVGYFTKFLRTVHVAVARFSSVDVAMCYVLPVYIMYTHNVPVVRHVYYLAAIEHNERNCRDSNQILLNDNNRKYSL